MASEEVGITTSQSYKKKTILYQVMGLNIFLAPNRNFIIFSSNVLKLAHLGKKWTAKTMIETLGVVYQITFKHAITLELVYHQLLTPQGVVIVHFRNRSKYNLNWGPNWQDSVSLI